MIIYKITHKLSGKIYIGQTIGTLKNRWGDHCSKGSCCTKLNRAIQKYGKDAFSVEVVAEYNNLEDLNNAEEYYISFYNSMTPDGYNLTTGGNNIKRSEETGRRISDALRGKPHPHVGVKLSEEHKRKLSEAHMNKGRPHSEETKTKMRKPKSQEHRENISKAKLGVKPSEETRRRLSESHKGQVPWNKGMKFVEGI